MPNKKEEKQKTGQEKNKKEALRLELNHRLHSLPLEVLITQKGRKLLSNHTAVLCTLFYVITRKKSKGSGGDLNPRPHTQKGLNLQVITILPRKTTDRDSLRYTYNGTRRVRQLALGCESS